MNTTLGKNLEKLILFNGMIPDILCNKNLKAIPTKLFICDRKLSISLASITQSYYSVLKNRLYNLHTQKKL